MNSDSDILRMTYLKIDGNLISKVSIDIPVRDLNRRSHGDTGEILNLRFIDLQNKIDSQSNEE